MKLRLLEELPPLLAGKKVVLANGDFDVLNVGHLRYLQEARKLGDVLVVAVHRDAPILNQEERAAVVSAIGCVDYVVIFDEPDLSRVVDVLKPAVHAKNTHAAPDIVQRILEKARK